MFVFKRSFREEHEYRGEKIGFDLKHLTASEERDLRARVVRAMGAIDTLNGAVERDVSILAELSAKALETMSLALPDGFLREAFGKYVSNVSGVMDDEGKVRTDGAFLIEFADDAFIWFVLLKLIGNGKVSAEEGKASGSPSGFASGQAPSTIASVSPVTSTVNEVGATPSTATEIPRERESSGDQAQRATT